MQHNQRTWGLQLKKAVTVMIHSAHTQPAPIVNSEEDKYVCPALVPACNQARLGLL